MLDPSCGRSGFALLPAPLLIVNLILPPLINLKYLVFILHKLLLYFVSFQKNAVTYGIVHHIAFKNSIQNYLALIGV